MLTPWRQWCRLCAKDESNVDIFLKGGNNYDIGDLLKKYFELSVDPDDEAPVTICTTCHQFLINLANFAERVAKVETMYSSITYYSMGSIDYTELMYQFGLIKKEMKAEPGRLEDKCDQATDTNDLHVKQATQERIVSANLTHSSVSDDNAFNSYAKSPSPKDNDMIELFTIEQISEDEKECIEEICVDYLDNSRVLDNSTGEEEPLKEKLEIKLDLQVMEPKSTTNSLSFYCDICKQNFDRKASYQYHKRTKHPKERNIYQCQKCGREFPTEKHVSQHENTHIKTLYFCTYCDKKFLKLTNLETHIRILHNSERPFICETCGKSFARRSALKEHHYTHMDETPFQCPSCPKKFKTQDRLKVHEDSHTSTTYFCPNCGLKLNTKRTLQMHMVVHSNQKKYKCTICSSEFKRAKALKNHLILHSGLRPYTCPFCDKTFTNGSNCRSHKKKAHPHELAAMEATGETSSAPNIPKLEQLKAS